jgi:agmatinase
MGNVVSWTGGGKRNVGWKSVRMTAITAFNWLPSSDGWGMKHGTSPSPAGVTGRGNAMLSSMKRQPTFLVLDTEPALAERSRYEVIPVPFEQSVSYGHGTAQGPAALLDASTHVEGFDGVDVPAEAGIWTGPEVACEGRGAEAVLADVTARVSGAVEQGRMPVMLGGEHTITLGAVRALHGRGLRFGVVQFDAHADLRDKYEGNPLSHGSVMRRIVDMGVPLFQVGVRSLSAAEAGFRWERRIAHVDASASGCPDSGGIIPPGFPEDIYITFDVDAFDPSVMPGTGTPEPGGLSWYDAVRALSGVVKGRRVLGFDVVELAPIAGANVSEFVAAKLVYTIMGLINRSAR